MEIFFIDCKEQEGHAVTLNIPLPFEQPCQLQCEAEVSK